MWVGFMVALLRIFCLSLGCPWPQGISSGSGGGTKGGPIGSDNSVDVMGPMSWKAMHFMQQKLGAGAFFLVSYLHELFFSEGFKCVADFFLVCFLCLLESTLEPLPVFFLWFVSPRIVNAALMPSLVSCTIPVREP